MDPILDCKSCFSKLCENMTNIETRKTKSEFVKKNEIK